METDIPVVYHDISTDVLVGFANLIDDHYPRTMVVVDLDHRTRKASEFERDLRSGRVRQINITYSLRDTAVEEPAKPAIPSYFTGTPEEFAEFSAWHREKHPDQYNDKENDAQEQQ